jgi:hypothetical protein
MNPRTKRPEGPVLKTIVNRAPRSEGRVVEFWNGFNDDDESIYLPDQPNFKMAVTATELPLCNVITFGNSHRSFAEYVLSRKGASLFTFRNKDHRHHRGLSTFEDNSPQLTVRITNGKRMEKPLLWKVESFPLILAGSLEGPGADVFSKQPGRLWIFIDEEKVLDLPHPQKAFTIDLPLDEKFTGEHILTLNWVSEYGPVAVNALRFSSSAPDVTNLPQSIRRKNP